MLSTLAEFDRRWKSLMMIEAREHVCRDYGSNEKTISQPEDLVLDFFEEIGLYLHKRVFDASTIWELYSYFVEHYWTILQPRIQEFRNSSQDKSWFSEFEFLSRELKKHSKKRKCPVGKSDADIQKFIRGEIRISEQMHAEATSETAPSADSEAPDV
jgi:hypothetical protein